MHRKPAAFELLWERCLTGAALVERDGRFVTANESFLRLLGYTSSELTELRFQSVTYPGDAPHDEEMAARVAAGTIESYTMTKRYLTKRSEVVWVRLRVDALRSPDDGAFVCFLAQAQPLGPVAAAVPAPAGAHDGVPLDVAWLVWAKTNWPILLWILSGLAALLGFGLQAVGKK